MSFQHWDAYSDFASNSIREYLSDEGCNVSTYLKKLNRLESEVIGEVRAVVSDESMTREYISRDILDHKRKQAALKSSLFEKVPGDIYFTPYDAFISHIDGYDGVCVRKLYASISRLGDIFEVEHKRLDNLDKKRVGKQGPRIPARESFEIIKGKNVNLQAVYHWLTQKSHPFITSNYPDFEKVFSGDSIVNKVNWTNLNALHYFIKSIHGRGIKRANEGHWNRSARLFTIQGKAVEPGDIKDADDISPATSELLQRAISPFLE